MKPVVLTKITDGVFNGNKRLVARAISIIENGNSVSTDLLNAIYSKVGNAYRIGITGPPGAGKSTLTDYLTKYYRNAGKKVGIIAVDPTSPFTGGALLGDRVRMNQIGNDDGVFIRSMATRGSLGGLSKKTIDAADVLDAAGFEIIIFETVGVGQSELDIAQAADTTVVTLVPESGDSVQAMKAGLMEIGDIFVINKSDRPGADSAVMSLKTILMMHNQEPNQWESPIIQTVAYRNQGIVTLAENIELHKNFLIENNLFEKNRQSKLKIRIKNIISNQLEQQIWNNDRELNLKNSLPKVLKGKLSPYIVANKIISNFKNEDNLRRQNA